MEERIERRRKGWERKEKKGHKEEGKVKENEKSEKG